MKTKVNTIFVTLSHTLNKNKLNWGNPVFLYNVFMRKVSLDKYKYSAKDFFRWIAIVVAHYLSFIILLFIALSVRYIFVSDYFPIGIKYTPFIYPILIAPFVNAMAHIIYAERGMTNLKAVLWIHSFAVTIWIVVLVSIV